jgi:chorismate mutase
MPRRRKTPPEPDLAAARAALDALDDVLIEALRTRVAAVVALWRAKQTAGVPLRDRARESAIRARARARARAPLAPDDAARLLTLVLQLTRTAAARVLGVRPSRPGRTRTPRSTPPRKSRKR